MKKKKRKESMNKFHNDERKGHSKTQRVCPSQSRGIMRSHLLGEALKGLWIAALVRLEVLGGGRLGLLSDDRRRRWLIGPAYVALGPGIVVQVAVARADVLRRAQTGQAQLRPRGKHLSAVASSTVAVPGWERWGLIFSSIQQKFAYIRYRLV